ncbi:MAG TPA: YeeE/YedE thiosulfate transporter family protein [Polyangiaceae bacterium]|nr:YeeE/YedE thiosulfate transporter family protein [Polyangiaceae bacterium]
MKLLQPLLVGFAFGWVLQKGKLGRYETIVNVFRLTDLTVLKFLLTGLAVAMLGIQSLESLGIIDDVPVAPTSVLGNLVGGLVYGAGMALAGFCPGTVAAGAGEGRLDYLIPGGFGLYTGAILFGMTYSKVFPALAGPANLGSVTVMQALHVDGWLVVILFWEIALLLFYLIERGPLRPAPRPPA